MKNYLFALFLLMVGIECFAGNPVQPYNENGYSISDTKNFSVGSTPLSEDWRKGALELVNQALVNSGESLVLTDRNLYWMLEHVSYERRKIDGDFWNSKEVDGRLVYFLDHDFDGMVAVFRYGRCEVILYKTICLNLLKVPQTNVPYQEDPRVTPVSSKVYQIDTLRGIVTVIDTVIYRTTVHDKQVYQSQSSQYTGYDQYYYGDGRTYKNYVHSQPVLYESWFSWPVFYYSSWTSYRESNCCCSYQPDYTTINNNYDNRNYYYGSRVNPPRTPTGAGIDPPSGGAGIDPRFQNVTTGQNMMTTRQPTSQQASQAQAQTQMRSQAQRQTQTQMRSQSQANSQVTSRSFGSRQASQTDFRTAQTTASNVVRVSASSKPYFPSTRGYSTPTRSNGSENRYSATPTRSGNREYSTSTGQRYVSSPPANNNVERRAPATAPRSSNSGTYSTPIRLNSSGHYSSPTRSGNTSSGNARRR